MAISSRNDAEVGVLDDTNFSWRTYLPALLVAGLGFLVDVYDVLLFAVLRVPSLRDLGVAEKQMLDVGVWLMNTQMVGLLLGGVVWGWIGDKKGRKAALFGSILCYSVATLANAYVTNVPMYALLRFVSGFGLAGEVGAAMTIAAEITPAKYRTYGTAAISLLGVVGSLLASYVGAMLPWRTAFLIAGIAGVVLLCIRVSMKETAMFERMTKSEKKSDRDVLRLVFTSPKRLLKIARCVLSALPLFFVFGVVVTFAPEINNNIDTSATMVAKIAALYSLGEILGEAVSGLLSQWLRSRRKVILLFQLCGAATFALFLHSNADQYVLLCAPLGFFVGFWAVVITSTAEQFGTNVRSTVTTMVPNIMRGCNIPLNLTFSALAAKVGPVAAMTYIAIASYTLAILCTARMEETFGRDLDFVES
jgi:MFS family permease